MRVLALVSIAVGCSNPSLLTPAPPAAEIIAPQHPIDAELKVNDSRRYRITLAAQQVATGAVMQQGVDVVVATYDPSGKKLGEFDSPNGDQGPEPFVVVGSDAGAYDIEVHPFPPPPGWKGTVQGKITTKVDEVISRDAYEDKNLAMTVDSARIRQLLTDVRHHKPNAADEFWKSLAGHAPIVEPYPGDPKSALVTWVMRTSLPYVGIVGGPGAREKPLQRIADTDLFYATARVPADSALNYVFLADELPPAVHQPYAKERPPGRFAKLQPDPNNPLHDQEFSRVELPGAPPAPLTQPRDGVAKGTLTEVHLKSAVLGEDRRVGIYTPPGYDPKQTYPLVIAFDGEAYGLPPFPPAIPLPTILDNLIADKKLPPVVAAIVANQGVRDRDLAASVPFSDFVANELVPKVRSDYHAGLTAAQTLVTGSSLGGVESTTVALHHSDVVGNVLSNSGAYQTRPNQFVSDVADYVEGGALISELAVSPKLPVRFYLDTGAFEDDLRDYNRRFRDVLRAKGYDVMYREFSGNHDYSQWKRTIADGLVALLGQRE